MVKEAYNNPHIAFKFYKATGKFHPDIGKLQTYWLLARNNYAVAEEIDILEIEAYKQIISYMMRYGLVIVYGSFLREALFDWLTAPNPTVKKRVKVNYIDCNELSDVNKLFTISRTTTITRTFPVFVIDFVDKLKRQQLKTLLEIADKSKYPFVLCLDKPDLFRREQIKMVRLGSVHREFNLSDYIYILFNNNDREKAIELYDGFKLNGYFLDMAMYNLPRFFKDSAQRETNIVTLLTTAAMLYKVSNDMLVRYLLQAFITTKVRKRLEYPKKIDLAQIK